MLEWTKRIEVVLHQEDIHLEALQEDIHQEDTHQEEDLHLQKAQDDPHHQEKIAQALQERDLEVQKTEMPVPQTKYKKQTAKTPTNCDEVGSHKE